MKYDYEEIYGVVTEKPQTTNQIVDLVFPGTSDGDRYKRVAHVYDTLRRLEKDEKIKGVIVKGFREGQKKVWITKDSKFSSTIFKTPSDEAILNKMTGYWLSTTELTVRIFGKNYTRAERDHIFRKLKRLEKNGQIEKIYIKHLGPKYNLWRLP